MAAPKGLAQNNIRNNEIYKIFNSTHHLFRPVGASYGTAQHS